MVESLPRLVRPMMAVLRHEPPAEGERWGWELKWDGVRAVAYVEGSSVRLMSRNDKDMRHTYPELAVLGEMLEVPVVLDGEIVALRPDERPSFSLLQRRMHVQRPTTRLLNHVPVHYYVFDLLHQDDRPLLGAPYIERRALLEE